MGKKKKKDIYEGPVVVSACAQLCLTLCDPMDSSLPGSSCPWDFPGKNTGVGFHFLLQGIFPTQGSIPHLVSYIGRQILYHFTTWEGHNLD